MIREGYKHGRKPRTKSRTGHIRKYYKTHQVLPLAPSPHHSEHHRQHRPKLTSFQRVALLSIWQLNDIKEGGRKYLNSPAHSYSFPSTVEVTDISITSLQHLLPCMLRFCNVKHRVRERGAVRKCIALPD